MEKSFNTVLISQEQIVNLFQNAEIAVRLAEQAFLLFKRGNVLLPDKISQIFDKETQERINCMTATLKDENVCGVKWVSVFPENPKIGVRNVSGIIILSELNYGLPIAIMDGTALTNIRTAAVSACAVKYLAREKAETIGFIGAGREARAHLDLICSVNPNLKKCYVSSRTEKSVESLIMEERKKHPDIEFIACGDDFEKAITPADIIITATSTQSDLLKAKWIKQGATYIHIGGWEDEFAVPQLADKIVCDRWDSVKHRGQTICRMYRQGLLEDKDIYADLVDIVSGAKPGRENDDEFIYFNIVGLAFVDVFFAKYIYENLKDEKETERFCF